MPKTVRVICTLAAFATLAIAARKPPFVVVDASIPQMTAALKQGRITSRELVTQSTVRIALYEDRLHAAIVVNPKALEEADALDRERAQHKVRGPLHGIPVAVKDNIQTTNMPTTGGALAFDGFVPPYEATLVKNLRDAGLHHRRQNGDDRTCQLGCGRLPRRCPATTMRSPVMV